MGRGRGINHKKRKRRKNTPLLFPNLCVFCAFCGYFSYFLFLHLFALLATLRESIPGCWSRRGRGQTSRFTPTALNSAAQRRAVPCEAFRRSMVAHAGVPTAPIIEPQRGSTNYSQNALGLMHCGTPLGFVVCSNFNPVTKRCQISDIRYQREGRSAFRVEFQWPLAILNLPSFPFPLSPFPFSLNSFLFPLISSMGFGVELLCSSFQCGLNLI